jgi:hypothetical protein
LLYSYITEESLVALCPEVSGSDKEGDDEGAYERDVLISLIDTYNEEQEDEAEDEWVLTEPTDGIHTVGAYSEGTSKDQAEEDDDSFFMRTYIPTSLYDIINPYEEMKKIEMGQRDAKYTEAITRMLGVEASELEGDDSDSDSDVSIPGETKETPRAVRFKAGGVEEQTLENDEGERNEDRDGSDSEEEDSSDNDDDEGYDGERRKKKKEKYTRTLPSHDDPEARKEEKQKRRDAAKLTKEAAKEKRKHKIPKHIKKKATKGSAKNH